VSASRRRGTRNIALALAIAAVAAACGQRGPLVLPEKARPIERIELPQPPAPASSPAPEKQDDEQKNER
jgi:predicted small lipoprotein YifL